MTTQTISEAQKMRQVPGVEFADGTFGRMARIAGTGIEVWEIIKIFHQLGRDRDALLDVFQYLRAEQVQAALAYYSAYPAEVDARLELEAIGAAELDRAGGATTL